MKRARSGAFGAVLLPLLFCIPAFGQGHYRGEEILSFFSPPLSAWEVAFENGADRTERPVRAGLRLAADGSLEAHFAPGRRAKTGLATVSGHRDLSAYEEIHLWVQADSALTVQPYSQSSGYVFRDGGDPDSAVPGDGQIVQLRIRGETMADPAMVERIGIQVREGYSRESSLRLLAVTAVRRALTARAPFLAIADASAPPAGSIYSVYTVDFNLNRSYDNPYDPGQIDVQARFVAPSGRTITIPAFWFQDFNVSPGTQTWEQYVPAGSPKWRIRFMPEEAGAYTLNISARDAGGDVDGGSYNFQVAAGPAPGPVRRHPANPLYLQYANGSLYFPFGHNLSFEDGNPKLNGVAYYQSLLPVFAASGENWTRFWMTDFSRTALEWGPGYEDYQGVGVYSQRAAWRVDRYLDTALDSGVQVQLVLNDHGQFSTYSNQRWNANASYPGNPYSSVYGGPVPQANPEQFFSNQDARALFRRRLRYIVARWSAYPNLLAWELFNEVQWAGTTSRNMRNDSATRDAIVAWHREMADALKSLDPFAHLVTTSSDDYYGSPGFDAIWKLASIDTVQSHHYNQPPGGRDARIREYAAAAQRAYVKPVVIAEMGVKADSQPECGFDPQAFLANTGVPASERTAANRDHMTAGTTLRNGIWSAALSQSGAMNWWWGCYMSDDAGKNRMPPEFPLHARLFPPLISFWGGEDPAGNVLGNAAIQTGGPILAYGLQGQSQALVWVRDALNAYGSGYGPATTESRTTSGASLSLSGMQPGSYVLSVYDTYGNGDLISQTEVTASGGTCNVALPPFLGDLAVKLNQGTTTSWGLVPRAVGEWITDAFSGDGPSFYAGIRQVPGFSDVKAGAVLTFSENDAPVWELTVPALDVSGRFWTIAEIDAPSQTGLALVNAGQAAAAVVLKLYDSEGLEAASRTLNLARGEHSSRFLVEWFGSTLAPFRGTLEVSSDQPLGALALRGRRNDLGQFVMTSIPMRGAETPQADQTLLLPQVADGGGYQTEWLLLNPGDASLTGTVSFRKSDGSPWALSIADAPAAEIRYSIKSHGLVRWVTSGTAPDTSAGYCSLVPDTGQAGPAGAAIIRYLPGNRLLSETGLPFLASTVSGATYWEVGPDLDTGIALVNTADHELKIGLQLFSRAGSERLRQAEVTVPARNHTARFVTELFPDLPAAGRGYLRVSSDSPVGFLPLRMRSTPGGVLFSSLLFGGLAGGTDRIFPQVVHGSGYRTQFIVVNPGDLAGGGRLSFFDGAGNPARVLLHTP